MFPLITYDGENWTFIVQSNHVAKENYKSVDIISSLSSLPVFGSFVVSMEYITAPSRVAEQNQELGCPFTALCHSDWVFSHIFAGQDEENL